jgi:hypothetical protein
MPRKKNEAKAVILIDPALSGYLSHIVFGFFESIYWLAF